MEGLRRLSGDKLIFLCCAEVQTNTAAKTKLNYVQSLQRTVRHKAWGILISTNGCCLLENTDARNTVANKTHFLSLSCLRGDCVKFPISFKLITVLRGSVCEFSSLCLTKARMLRVDQGTDPNLGH